MSHFDSSAVTCLFDITTKDMLDTRDLDELLERLDGEMGTEETQEFEGLTDELTEVQKALLATREDMGDSAWGSRGTGTVLIHEAYFKAYARQSAEDMGYLGEIENNPLSHCIDWDSWADNMRADYSEVEIGDTTFYYSES